MPMVVTKVSGSKKDKEHVVDEVSGDLFCLQSSDHLCMILVSVSLVGSRNYRSWNKAMRVTFVTGYRLAFY